MKNMFLIILSSSFLLAACGGGGNNAKAPTAVSGLDLNGFEAIDIEGGGEFLTKMNGDVLAEQGVIKNGAKEGMWVTFHPEGQVKTIQNYVNGVPTGMSLELNNRGQIDKRTGYLNNELHGPSTTFKFGRPLKTITYDQGMLNGPFEEYNDRGKIQKRGSFKDGKQHGKLEFFDEEENLVMEYEYDMGEKVSGGIIEKK